MLPSEILIWQPEFTDKTLSRKPGAVHGDSWTNEKHQIMAGVVFSLRRALEQAEVFPSDPEWKWPFSICPNSENTFQKIGQKVALEEHQPTVS